MRRGNACTPLYVAAAPEYGKATFLGRLERELARVKAAYTKCLLNSSLCAGE